LSDGDGVAARLASIRRRIDDACRRAGRDPASVTLIGASKMQPPARLREAFDAGLSIFGENRVQEAQAKAGELPSEIDWHLFGPLQSNKARPAAELFSTIHSLDRPKIARALDREAARLGRTLRCFIEVNLGDEENKHGFPADRLPAALDDLLGYSHLSLVGLMAVPPYDPDPEASRPWFRRLRALAEALVERPGWEGFSGQLSMGMSGDFEVAIEEGATHVRIGTALFGERGA
jgi:pyridoxal phosphate enzyme (YggS family)